MRSSKVLMWGCSSLIACVLRKCMAIGVISLVFTTLAGKVQNWYLFLLEEPWWLTQKAFPQVQLGWLKSRKALFNVCDYGKGFILGVPCTACRQFFRSSRSVEWLLSFLPPSLPPSIPTFPLCLCLSLFLSLLLSPSPGPYFVSVYMCVCGGVYSIGKASCHCASLALQLSFTSWALPAHFRSQEGPFSCENEATQRKEKGKCEDSLFMLKDKLERRHKSMLKLTNNPSLSCSLLDKMTMFFLEIAAFILVSYGKTQTTQGNAKWAVSKQ